MNEIVNYFIYLFSYSFFKVDHGGITEKGKQL